MSSRVLLSIVSMFIGGVVVFSLTALGVLPVVLFRDLSLDGKVLFILVHVLPILTWLMIFSRRRKHRRHFAARR